MREKIEHIAKLAEARRVVRLGYNPPGEDGPRERLVEPYRLQRTAGGPAVHSWERSSSDGRPDGWRDFRLDRITSVADAGQSFQPRMPVTLVQEVSAGAADATAAALKKAPGHQPPAEAFHSWGDRPIAAMGPAEDYFRYLEDAMLDAKVTPGEMGLARSLGDRVEPHERKAVHARVYANILHEVLQDSRISHREELYLQTVRKFLEQLGWAP